eukprot:gene11989-16051_t
MNGKGNDIERELDIFFEQAAEAGSSFIRKLTPEQRFERAQRGEELENLIFDIRDKLVNLENSMLNGDLQIDINLLTSLREEMKTLKNEYIMIVGGKDIPLYFGKLPDSFQ